MAIRVTVEIPSAAFDPIVYCRMSGDRQPIRSPLASCMSARIAKITGDDPWAVKMRAQTRRYYHIDETHIDDLADDPADEAQP